MGQKRKLILFLSRTLLRNYGCIFYVHVLFETLFYTSMEAYRNATSISIGISEYKLLFCTFLKKDISRHCVILYFNRDAVCQPSSCDVHSVFKHAIVGFTIA